MPATASAHFLAKVMRHTRLEPDEQQAVLALASEVLSISAHSDFIRRGEPVNSACLVIEGLLARTCDTLSGSRQISALYVPGEMPDIHGLLVPTATSTLHAISPARIVRVSRSAVRDAVKKFPILMEAFWRETIIDAAISFEWTVNVGQRQAKSRIAHLFAELAVRTDRVAGNSFDYAFPGTQTHISEATGMSTVHVNRSLQSLKAEGVLEVVKGQVNVLSWDGLVAVGEFDDRYLSYGEPQRLLA